MRRTRTSRSSTPTSRRSTGKSSGSSAKPVAVTCNSTTRTLLFSATRSSPMFSAGMVACIHLCRGNSVGQWAAEGGYEPVAEVLLNQVDVDAYFLEYDDERSGDFAPLRFFPRHSRKRIVLGLVSTKLPALESKDALKRRIEAAAKFVPLENLCLSPQCGFASTYRGNPISEEMQRRKLERVVEVATEVWGSAR